MFWKQNSCAKGFICSLHQYKILSYASVSPLSNQRDKINRVSKSSVWIFALQDLRWIQVLNFHEWGEIPHQVLPKSLLTPGSQCLSFARWEKDVWILLDLSIEDPLGCCGEGICRMNCSLMTGVLRLSVLMSRSFC